MHAEYDDKITDNHLYTNELTQRKIFKEVFKLYNNICKLHYCTILPDPADATSLSNIDLNKHLR